MLFYLHFQLLLEIFNNAISTVLVLQPEILTKKNKSFCFILMNPFSKNLLNVELVFLVSVFYSNNLFLEMSRFVCIPNRNEFYCWD